MMRIYRFELKKLLSSVAVWGFLAACLSVNMAFVCNSRDPYGDFIGTVSKQTGYVLNNDFYDKLSKLTVEKAHADYLERLKIETENVEDVFEGYNAKRIGERYIEAAKLEGIFAEAMRHKYARLQKVTDEKAKNDESLSLYFAGSTYYRHQFLFNDLIGFLLTEGALASVLLALLAAGYEGIYRTENLVYSSKKGREILRPKLFASLSAGLMFYALLAFITFLVYFGINDFGGIGKSFVSSVFNYRIDLIAGDRPFITWQSFTVQTYLLAVLFVGAGIVLCFSLMAFGIGVFVRNSYISFFLFLIANAATLALPLQMPLNSIGYAVISVIVLSPVTLWLKHGLWFTDGDIDIVWTHFETLGLFVSLVVLTAFCLLALHYFRKRNLT
jgi:hypothetical protein